MMKNSKAELEFETIIGIIIAVVGLIVLLAVYSILKGGIDLIPG